jgi:hypothetical protein
MNKHYFDPVLIERVKVSCEFYTEKQYGRKSYTDDQATLFLQRVVMPFVEKYCMECNKGLDKKPKALTTEVPND